MSHIRLRPAPALLPGEAVAGYDRADFTLTAEQRGMTPADRHRAAIETITLLFTPDKHVLTGFDAYTNAEKWERQLLALPPVDRKTALLCSEPFDVHGIGPTDEGPVRYIYAPEASLLLIRIGDSPIDSQSH